MSDSESVAVYLRFKKLFTGSVGRRPSRISNQRPGDTDASRQPFGTGRDPRELGSIVDALTSELGWNSQLSQSELMLGWADVVGEETSRHATPDAIADGVLMVGCSSSAWAAQLRTMANQLVTEITLRFPDAGIRSIRFRGPDAPSWKRGPRSIPGRGPRDTYG